jgi:hypothetical protein
MFEFLPPQVRLQGAPKLREKAAARLRSDFEKFRRGLPRPLEKYVLETFGIDLGALYGGVKLKNPFGKASGQLSMTRQQVEKDALAGLGFVVLKTVIAQDSSGQQSMREWAIPETRMQLERIRGRGGKEGWTVTWIGRGWFGTFEAYRQLFDEALTLGKASGMLVAPSVKYHLPTPEENSWKEAEYTFTTKKILDIWKKHHPATPMPIEKDFSPTLAGSSRAEVKAKIIEWLRKVPGLIGRAAPGEVCVGIKVFNALFEDDFQLQMLETLHAAKRNGNQSDFLIYANRLFDRARSFEGKTGVAYGGPDLSDRNLAVLERFLAARSESKGQSNDPAEPGLLPFSATGDIHSGRIAAEYLLRGASSFQVYTLFQLADSEFTMEAGSKTEKALHTLLFHPEEGFLAWVLDLRERFGLKAEANVQDVANWFRNNWSAVTESLSVPTRQ